jgi:hypothetical protein
MTDIDALIERIEQATGPDRRLDVQIEIATDPKRRWIVGHEPGRFPRTPIYGTLADLWEWAVDESKEPPEIGGQRFTASLDAAMTLVPEGCLFMTCTLWDTGDSDHDKIGAGATVKRYTVKGGGRFFVGETAGLAATPALALCAAALRARKEQSK